jgi:hypothetical protein
MVREVCRICKFCFSCTGFGSGCVNHGRSSEKERKAKVMFCVYCMHKPNFFLII